MTAHELLARLRARGAKLELRDDGRLRILAPAGVLTPDVRAAILARRAEMIALLRTFPCSGCGRFAFHVPVVCYWCRRAAAPNN